MTSLLAFLTLAILAGTFSGCGKTEAQKVEALDIPLTKKRVLVECAKKNFVEAQKKVNEMCGYTVPIEVDWKSLAVYDDSYTKVTRVQNYGFNPILEGIAALTKDDMGKKALAAKLKKIVIAGKDPKKSGNMKEDLWFKDGTLFTRQAIDGNGYYSGDRVKELLEKNL